MKESLSSASKSSEVTKALNVNDERLCDLGTKMGGSLSEETKTKLFFYKKSIRFFKSKL